MWTMYHHIKHSKITFTTNMLLTICGIRAWNRVSNKNEQQFCTSLTQWRPVHTMTMWRLNVVTSHFHDVSGMCWVNSRVQGTTILGFSVLILLSMISALFQTYYLCHFFKFTDALITLFIYEMLKKYWIFFYL